MFNIDFEKITYSEIRKILYTEYVARKKEINNVINQAPEFWSSIWDIDPITISREFGLNDNDLEGVHIIFAVWESEYIYSDIDEVVYLLIVKNDKLYSVEAHANSGRGNLKNHQWVPEETSIEKIIYNIIYNDLGSETGEDYPNAFNMKILNFICNCEDSLNEEFLHFQEII